MDSSNSLERLTWHKVSQLAFDWRLKETHTLILRLSTFSWIKHFTKRIFWFQLYLNRTEEQFHCQKFSISVNLINDIQDVCQILFGFRPRDKMLRFQAEMGNLLDSWENRLKLENLDILIKLFDICHELNVICVVTRRFVWKTSSNQRRTEWGDLRLT